MTQNDKPLFSIAIPTYNRLALLKEALSSAQAQTYSNLEIVVFDNASTDGTVDWLLKQAKLDSRIRLVFNKENVGMNKNIEQVPDHIKGKYLLILSDDDLIEKSLAEKAVSALEADPSLCIWFAQTQIFCTDDKNQYHALGQTNPTLHGLIKGQELISLTFRRKLQIYWCSLVYRVAILKKVDGFKCGSYWLDMAANLSCAIQGNVFGHNKVLAYYRQTNFNMSKNLSGNPMAALKEYELMYQKIRQYTSSSFDKEYLSFATCCSLGFIASWSKMFSYWKIWQFLSVRAYPKRTILFLLFLNIPRTLFRLTFGLTAKKRFLGYLKKIFHY